MTGPDLRSALHDLGEQARVPDLLDRALATSRRIRRRRIAVGAGGTAVVLVTVAVAVTTLRSPDTIVAPPASGSSVPSPSSAVPTTTSPPATTASPSPSASASARALPALRGTLHYYRWNPKLGHGEILAVRDGTVEGTDLPTDTLGTASISPDGRVLAWVTAAGSLLVADPDGGNARTIASDAVPMDFNVPAWSPDSSAVTFVAAAGPIDGPRTTVGPIDRVSVNDGARQRIWSNGYCSLSWAPDGKYLGYANCTGGAGVLDVAHGTDTGPDLTSIGGTSYLAAVSPDGQQILVQLGRQGYERTDRPPLGLFEVESGARIPLPVTNTISGGQFLVNGDLLVRTADRDGIVIRQITPTGQTVAQTTEPPDLGQVLFINFTAD
jgi:hypothetical protein